MEYCLEFPTHGKQRPPNELRKRGVIVSAGGIRSIWLRHHFQIKSLRLKRLEQWAVEETNVSTESQIQTLQEAKEEKEAYGEMESPHPGFLIAQDTCYIGFIKGVGRIYQQTALDTHSNTDFAKVNPEKNSLTAADFLNDKVLPFFDEHAIRVFRVLTDHGPEFYGRQDTHPYQLFLHLNDIEHTKTRVRKSQTSGALERLHQIIQEEFYKVASLRKLYRSPEQIQADLDKFMAWYNT